MITITDVIAMKNENNILFETNYQWLLQTIENYLISKSNGIEQVKQLLSDYDYCARVFIVHQFQHFGKEQLAMELTNVLEINFTSTILEDRYVEELIDEL